MKRLWAELRLFLAECLLSAVVEVVPPNREESVIIVAGVRQIVGELVALAERDQPTT